MDRFRRHVNAKNTLNLETYHDLHAWSTDSSTLDDFWTDALEFLGIKSPLPSGSAICYKPDKLFPPVQFFPNVRLNLAEFLLRRASIKDVANETAVIAVREAQPTPQRVTWGDLRERVRHVYDAMLNCGVQEGDQVAAVICNSIDAMAICLATLALGAVYSSTSPDMGTDAIIQRFGQISPKMVFTESSYTYGGQNISLVDRIKTWTPKLRSNTENTCQIVILPHQDTYPREAVEAITWDDFLLLGSGQDLQFKQLPFSSPAFILYTSGTTGLPKCVIHSAGAAALKVLVDQQLHNDVRPDDVVLQYTTTAWVMWVFNFILLGSGATIVLYDGSPFHPKPGHLLQMIEDFGTVTSTGSALPASQYEWFYKIGFHPHTHLISMCGGTDLLGCLYAGEIQAKALGMAVDVLDGTRDEPVSVANQGLEGELVCRQPFPSQPIGFYGSDGPRRYQKAYFERYGDSIWQQGDFVRIVPDTKGIIIYGRSDGVLNPSGIRFGPADIYSVTERIPTIADAICVGRQLEVDMDEKVILFVKLSPGLKLHQSLQLQIRQTIAQKLSRRHVPRYIFQVKDIPCTVNGKRCESHVKSIMNGRPPPAVVTMANPECLKEYEHYHQLLSGEKRQPVQHAKL
ncbi:hypothetical protein FANTH_10100 [Fusarium anthophilum]|uniref:Acetoacetyl-CoA synthetase n=1 Tax=Fusarium anthophilum TaxID=48485 RepID=A0A8H4Z2I2_9HYPO|nr:hypothetical protein FANTH_10100 [Fusarium anthophilum]